MLMFVLMNAFAKHLSAQHSVIEIAFYRNVVAALPFLIMAFVFGRRDILIAQARPGLMITRAVMGSVSLSATFAAFSLMPMADASALLFTASLFIPLLGVVVLKEPLGWVRSSAIVVGFVGVLIMIRPTGATNVLGISVALVAAFLQAIMAIILRQLGGYEKPETVALYFFLIGAALTGLAMPFFGRLPAVDELPLLLGVGISGAIAQWLYAIGLKYTQAAVVAVMSYSSIVWALLLGWLVWGDWPLPVVLAGAAVVIAANTLIIWRETHLARKARSPVPPA